jgi:hypothetical protein
MSRITALLMIPPLASDTQDWRLAIAAIIIGAIVEISKYIISSKRKKEKDI